MKTSEPRIIVRTEIEGSLAVVWKALTDLDQMLQWYFDNIPTFEAREGFETSFVIENEGRTFTHNWKVLQVTAEKQLSKEWTFSEYPGVSVSHFKLAAKEGGKVDVLVEVEVLEDFPNDIPEFKRESCEGGWNYFLISRLKPFVEGLDIVRN